MKRRNFVGLLGAGTVGWSLPKAAYSDVAESILDGEATQEDPRFRAIAALVEAKMAEYRVPGVALGILKGGVLTMRGFGLTNLDNPQPVTPETVFPIASITKTVVTVAMLRMVDEGRVDLDGPIVEYLPEFRLRDPDASHQVTIRHLLTHTPGWEGDLAFLEGFDGSVLEAFVGSLVDVPFLAPPGEVWGYNNAGFNVAGRVLEVVTGRSIREVLSDLVFSPLGLSRAFTRTGDALLYRFAAPHLERDGATRVDRPFELPATTASGGAAMSLASLMAYASFHLGDGTAPSGERLLTRSSLELMRTPQLVKRPTTEEMGVGLHLRRLGSVLTAVHCGQLFSHCLKLELVPERDLAFAILTNHMQGWRLHSDVEASILDTYEDLRLSPDQATGGDRGSFEWPAHTTPVSPQPSLTDYPGTYLRTPNQDRITLAVQGGRLIASGLDFGIPFMQPLTFSGVDRAFIDPDAPIGYDVPYPYRGAPVEFIRDEAGDVGWCRYVGRIARRA